jgi:hypothetical protein
MVETCHPKRIKKVRNLVIEKQVVRKLTKSLLLAAAQIMGEREFAVPKGFQNHPVDLLREPGETDSEWTPSVVIGRNDLARRVVMVSRWT